MLFGDEVFHVFHLAFIGQHDHHGGVPLVGQHDDGDVVFSILVEVVATCPLHHINLNLGGFIHIEVHLLCLVAIKGFLPLS